MIKKKRKVWCWKLLKLCNISYIHACILHINSSTRMFLFNSWFYFCYDRHKHLRACLFWVFRKKETLADAIISKICFVDCVINCTDMSACISAIAWVLLTSLNILINFDHPLCNVKYITFLIIPLHNISKLLSFWFTFCLLHHRLNLSLFLCF